MPESKTTAIEALKRGYEAAISTYESMLESGLDKETAKTATVNALATMSQGFLVK